MGGQAAEWGPNVGEDDRREWSRLELAGIIREQVASHLAAQEKKFDLLRDGAQAALLTQTMMVGDLSLGLEGFIPKTERTLKELSTNAETSRKLYDERDATQNERLSGIENQVAIFGGRQRRIWKALREIADSATRSNGKWDYVKLSALAAATYEGIALVSPHMINWWNEAKKIAAAMVAAAGK